MHVVSLHIYPVKSLGQVSCSSVQLYPWGPEGDRRWMVVDLEGRFITQRTTPTMAQLKASWQGETLILRDGTGSSVMVEKPQQNECHVQVWKSHILAYDAGEEAALWLSERFGRSCRLVYMPDPARARPQHYQGHHYVSSFADGFPGLLCTQASLDDLNARLNDPVPMERFRPNIVVGGTVPWEEDRWHRLAIGDVIIEAVKPCSRCVMTTVDQKEGNIPVAGQPLKTLGTFRRREGGIMFGQNVLIERSGCISVGDDVRVLS